MYILTYWYGYFGCDTCSLSCMQMCVIVCVFVSVTMILIHIESIDTHVNRVHVWVCIFAKTCTTSSLAANTLSDPAAKQNAIHVWPSSVSRRTIAQKSFNLAMQQHAEVFFHSRFLPPLDCNIIMPVQGNNSYSTDLWRNQVFASKRCCLNSEN